MTRNTKFYKVKNSDIGDIYYRDLNVTELSVLDNIKNPVIRNEMAADITITNIDANKVPFEIKVQIGEDILYRSKSVVLDSSLLEVTINDMRKRILEGDPVISWISHLVKYFPGTSITDLLSLTFKDLIELVVMAEEITGEKIFGAKQKKGMSLINPSSLPDGGKALRNQIRDLNNSIGLPK